MYNGWIGPHSRRTRGRYPSLPPTDPGSDLPGSQSCSGEKLRVKIPHKSKVIQKQRKDLEVNISPPRIEMTLKVRANAPELPENVADLLEGKAEELAQLFVDFADELAEKHSLPGLLPAVRHQISGPRANRIGRVSASSVTRKAAKSIEGKEKS